MKRGSRWIWITIGLMMVSVVIVVLAKWWLGAWSDAFSFGQLLVAVLLLPLVLYEFEKVRDDIKQAQKVPSLRLYYERSAGQLEEEIVHDVRKPVQVSNPMHTGLRLPVDQLNLNFVLRNHGDAVAVWYAVEVDIPKIFYNNLLCSPGSPAASIVRKELSNGTIRFIFNSDGRVAVYPSQQTLIFTIPLALSDTVYQLERVSFPYTIYTDRTDPATGILIVQFKQV